MRFFNRRNIFYIFLILIILLLVPKESVYAAKSSSKSSSKSSTESDTLDPNQFNDLANLTVMTDADGKVYIKQYKENKDNLQTKAWNTVFSKYEMVILGISGVITLTFVLLFMTNIAQFSMAAGNPQERQKHMKALLWTGIGSAGFGATTLIMGVAFKTFQQ